MVKLKDMGLTTVVLVVALLCILNASGAWSQLDPGMRRESPIRSACASIEDGYTSEHHFVVIILLECFLFVSYSNKAALLED